MSKPNWYLTFLKLTFPRNPKPSRLSKIPAISRWIEKNYFEGDFIITLPRKEELKIDRKIGDPDQMVLPLELIDYVIDKMEYHVIMNFCICRKNMVCKDYPIEYGCLFMGEPVLGINPEWGRRVTKQEAKDYMRKCEDAGLIHFIGRSKLDTKWLGIGPGEKLFTICNCCPCCCITRGIVYADESMNSKLIKAPGLEVRITDACTGCGKCTEKKICITHAISLDGDRAVINDKVCRGCGRCVRVCPQKAIKITIDKNVFMDESIKLLRKAVQIPE